ncbi:hypothetical protein D3C73_618030 [compost metagenome]
MSLKLVHQIFHIFIIQATVRVYDIHDINYAIFNHFKRFKQLVLHDVRECHNIYCSFVTTIMEYLHQLERFINILDVASYTNQVEKTFTARQNIIFINTPDIHQCRQLRISFLRNYFFKEIIIQKTPRTCLICTFQQLWRVFITNLHIIYTSFIQASIQFLHKFNTKIPVIDQTSVTDRTVNYFALIDLHPYLSLSLDCFTIHLT